MGAKLPVEIYKEAQAAEKSGDLERAIKLYAQSQWHFKAVNLALDLGRISDAHRFYRPIQGDMLPNRDTGNQFQGMEDSIYLGLTGTAGSNVGFNGLYGNVLDVGCREGRFFGLLRRFGADKVYGVDLDSDAVAEAKKRSEVSSDDVLDCKVEDFPAKHDGPFDHVVIFNLSLGGTEDRKNAIEGITRVLKPEGKLLATFTTLDELRNYSPEINQHFTTRYASLINGSGELDSAPHRYVMQGVRK